MIVVLIDKRMVYLSFQHIGKSFGMGQQRGDHDKGLYSRCMKNSQCLDARSDRRGPGLEDPPHLLVSGRNGESDLAIR